MEWKSKTKQNESKSKAEIKNGELMFRSWGWFE